MFIFVIKNGQEKFLSFKMFFFDKNKDSTNIHLNVNILYS